jgi:hypothetical protein
VYLGYVISGGELNINPTKINTVIKWIVPTNVIEVKIFSGVAQYLRKFIAYFSMIIAPLHTIKKNNKSFYWGKNQ